MMHSTTRVTTFRSRKFQSFVSLGGEMRPELSPYRPTRTYEGATTKRFDALLVRFAPLLAGCDASGGGGDDDEASVAIAE